ncbi:ArsI/CadI family heavy metal resistance metalloenzyme [Lysobacter koreensis]|uniref:ArsI/CadI family heavy metal resistance metalloenzyme n=1 Tax=Lysobacter koreensis TaxID=266122 RepID=A0ABW2YS51_9GAMM
MTEPTTRFHVHIHVADLDANLRFYSQLFGAQPTVRKHDYAKWMLDDPRVNFAISTDKDGALGIAHLGLQAESEQSLAAIGARLQAADAVSLAETGTTCCYARSDKFWAQDPQGVQWESFHTHGDATTYYADPAGSAVERDSCCGPATASCATACSVPPAAQVTSNAAACCG